VFDSGRVGYDDQTRYQSFKRGALALGMRLAQCIHNRRVGDAVNQVCCNDRARGLFAARVWKWLFCGMANVSFYDDAPTLL